jgi:hypothetical protein
MIGLYWVCSLDGDGDVIAISLAYTARRALRAAKAQGSCRVFYFRSVYALVGPLPGIPCGVTVLHPGSRAGRYRKEKVKI